RSEPASTCALEELARGRVTRAQALAIRVREMELEQAIAGEVDGRRAVGFLDVHVEEIDDDPDPVDSDLRGERARLLDAVDEKRLVAVERLNGQPDVVLPRVERHLADGGHRMRPFLGVARDRADPPLGRGYDPERGGAEPCHEIDAPS